MYSFSVYSSATPSFVSVSDKIYIDDADVVAFCELRNDILSDLCSDSDWLCNALTSASDDVCQCVSVIARRSKCVGNMRYNYVNIWDCTYSFEFCDVMLDFVWIDDGECFRRVTKLHAKSLFLENAQVRFSFGEPGVIRFSDDGVSSMVYLDDMMFSTFDDMVADIYAPCVGSKQSHILEKFLDYVVADG